MVSSVCLLTILNRQSPSVKTGYIHLFELFSNLKGNLRNDVPGGATAAPIIMVPNAGRVPSSRIR